ncbi:carboxypeptidase-like regulatory domain-containing protein [Flavicella sediminum]|uniref:carboxypeptidase-like regulatory domain-containing protein n=1 Tax=Flavicella sediminum TaxID=2585141 RepID=UPI001123ABA6|nr:carboxypeptidase-like regulatory domain-containing protein [Flavicella sediminum]
MQKLFFSLLICFLACTSVQSQEIATIVSLKGQILDGISKKPLMGSHILNLNDVVGATTDFDGRFEIKTAVNDTLMISYVGYQSIKLKITNDLMKGNELSITLHEKANEISEVVVKTHNLIGVLEIDVKQVPKDKYSRIHINGIAQTYEVGKGTPKSMNTVTAAVYHPVDFLYNMFGKKPKALKKLKKLKEKDNLREILGNKFDREVMLEYLNMNDKELNELLDDCNYSEYFIKTASDLQVVEAILDCHENYKALKKGSVAQ